MPYSIKAKAGKLYRPSNGTEGMMFTSAFCDRCEYDADEDNGCEILGRTLYLDVDHPEYPTEWTHNDEGEPLCTAFKERTAA